LFSGRAPARRSRSVKLVAMGDHAPENWLCRSGEPSASGNRGGIDDFMCAQRADKIFDESAIDYSICTLVTRKQQYGEMIASFRSGGFLEPSCEYLYLDNSAENSWDAYRGYNLFLNVARGKYIILCHQDILLLADGRRRLDEIIAELDRLDPNWGLLGNAGGYRPGQLALRISDPRGPDQRVGELPARVRSLDENFIVVRRSANLALSRDLSGFHFYGTDLCMIGDLLGYTAYVVDFHLLHKGGGICDAVFYQAYDDIAGKYRRAFRPRYVQTTCATLFVSGSRVLQFLLSRAKSIATAAYLSKLRRAFFNS